MSNKWRGYSSLINGGKTTKKWVIRIIEKKDEWVWFTYKARGLLISGVIRIAFQSATISRTRKRFPLNLGLHGN
jgi:hypothetical protein